MPAEHYLLQRFHTMLPFNIWSSLIDNDDDTVLEYVKLKEMSDD